MVKIHGYGVDWSVYQGVTGKHGYDRDKFVIAQIGGITANGIYTQKTYATQIAHAKSQGRYTHTYIWYQVGGSKARAKLVLDYFLPRIKSPKGSIVALDYEAGASSSKSNNTEAILYGMERIKSAGYTPVYYSYKPYTVSNVDYKRINAKYPNSIWIASYIDYKVRTEPNFNYFPSLDGVALWQFTSTYKNGGLDGNVDLTGIATGANVKKVAEVNDKSYITSAKTIKTKKPIYIYKSTKFDEKDRVALFKKGTTFNIKKVVKVGGITRLLTQSGYYITGNKDYVRKIK